MGFICIIRSFLVLLVLVLYQCAGITLDVCCIHAGLHHSKGRLPSSGKTWQHMTLNRGYVAY